MRHRPCVVGFAASSSAILLSKIALEGRSLQTGLRDYNARHLLANANDRDSVRQDSKDAA